MAGPNITPDIDPATGKPILPPPTNGFGLVQPPPPPPTPIYPLRPYDPADMPSVSGQTIGVDNRTDEQKFIDRIRERIPQGLKNADAGYRQFLADHPAANYAVNYGVPAVSPPGMGALSALLAPKVDLPPPTADKSSTSSTPADSPTPPAQGGGVPSVGVNDLLSGEGPATFGPSSVGMGPGGLGSDRAIQNAQNDFIAGNQALVDKRTEEAGARIEALKFGADAESAKAQLKAIFANHQKQVDGDIAKEQTEADNKIEDERRKAAALGVDPGRVYRNMGTGGKIAFIIGALASGGLSGLTHTPNNFMSNWNEIVKNDIAAQDTNINQAWKKVSGMQTSYENLVRRGVDKRVAENTYLGQVLDATENELKARLAKASLPAEKANLQAGIQSLQNQRTQLDVEMQRYWGDIYARRSAAASAAAAAAAERLFQHRLETYKAETGRMGAVAELEKAGGERESKDNAGFIATSVSPDGKSLVGVQSTPELATKVSDAQKNHEVLMRGIQEMRRLRGEVAGGGLGRAGSAMTPVGLAWERQIDSEEKKMIEALNANGHLGAYDSGTAKLLEGRVGSMKSVGPKGDELLDQLEKQANRDYQAYLHASGGVPAAKVYIDGKWRVVQLGPGTPAGGPQAPAPGGSSSIPGFKPFGQ